MADTFPGVIEIACGVSLVQLFWINKTQDGQLLLYFSSLLWLYLLPSILSIFLYLFTVFLVVILTHVTKLLVNQKSPYSTTLFLYAATKHLH